MYGDGSLGVAIIISQNWAAKVASMDQSSAPSHYRQLPFGRVCRALCEALAEVWLTDWAFRMESISIPMWSLSILSAGLASCLWQEIIDPLGVLFRFKMELYSLHEMCLARNFKGSPHDRALPWGRPQQAPARMRALSVLARPPVGGGGLESFVP